MEGRRVLTAGGLLLILAGVLYSLGYTALAAGTLETTGAIDLELALNAAVRGQPELARGYARELTALENERLRHWLGIAHLAGSGVIALALSGLLPALKLKPRWEKIIACLFVLGGALSAAGFFIHLLGYSFYGWLITLLGYLWLLAGIAGFIAALVLHAVAEPGL